MKAEKAANIALEYDELINRLDRCRYEKTFKMMQGVCENSNSYPNSLFSLIAKYSHINFEGFFLDVHAW